MKKSLHEITVKIKVSLTLIHLSCDP